MRLERNRYTAAKKNRNSCMYVLRTEYACMYVCTYIHKLIFSAYDVPWSCTIHWPIMILHFSACLVYVSFFSLVLIGQFPGFG